MNSIQSVPDKNYAILVQKLTTLLQDARRQVYTHVNTILLTTYWTIGKEIVLYEQKGNKRATYGKSTLKHLSHDLSSRFTKGFSERNLEQMRKFYLTWQKPQTLSAKSFPLSWSHYVMLMTIADSHERTFYEIETEKNNWSVRELKRQYDSSLYERLSLSRDKERVRQLSAHGNDIKKTEDLFKEPYILEFLGLGHKSEYTESDIETAILNNLEQFILELGRGFTFVARQQRITSHTKHYYIDLVFYNRLLNCFVLIDIKIGRLKHQDIGQMQMYVNYYDREIKKNEENLTIGIILCKEKDDFVIEYTLPENNRQIFPKKYRLYLPSKEELKEEMKRKLG